MIVEGVGRRGAGTATILPQAKGEVTKAPKLRKEDGRIDWTRPARAVHDLVRAMQPWPVASTTGIRPRSARRPCGLIVHETAVVEGVEGEPGRVLGVEGAGSWWPPAAGACG